MTPPAIDLAALRTLAEKATPGPWRSHRGTMSVGNGSGCIADCDQFSTELEAARNADFIAAANPRTVLALLDRLAAASEVVEAARAVYDEDDVWCADDDGGMVGVRDKALGNALSNYDRAIAGQQPRPQEGTTDA